MEHDKEERPEELGVNLTPMIDVVFLLVSFFMIVTQLVSNEVEVLYLPTADVEVDRPEEERTIVNVTRDGRITMRGEQLDGPRLRLRLGQEADRDRLPESRFSTRRVLVRADRDALYDVVSHVMIACAEVGITDIQFGARAEAAEGR